MQPEVGTSEGVVQRLAICIVDDNPDHGDLVLRSIRRGFADEPLAPNVTTYLRPAEALADLPHDRQTVILIDYRLGNGTGLDWLPDFLRPNLGPVVMMTSSGDEEVAAEAFRRGASDYQIKGDLIRNPALLRRCLIEALRRYNLVETNRRLSRRLKATNVELTRKNEALSEMAMMAQRFVADVAHEFRTPLTVIKEFASLIDDGLAGDVTAKQSDFLRFITEATRDLSGLVDDFLDSSKLRARNLRIDRRRVNISEGIDHAWRILEERAASKRVTISRHIGPDLPLVFADAEKVCRSLINLGMNAIKFSPEHGTVAISIEREGDQAVRVAVRDEGPGIDEETSQRLFTRFGQSAVGAQSTVKGFGLGLSIVADLVEVNLGTLLLESRPGEGSTFSFTIPASDDRSVIQALLGRLGARQQGDPVTAITVRRMCSPEQIDALMVRIASCCRPLDLVLPIAGTDTMLLIGESNDPRLWCQRLTERLAEPCGGDPALVPECSTPRLLGAWPRDLAEEELLRVLSDNRMEVAC